MRTVKLLDTTLRDGEQMSGINLNIGDKVRIAHMLDILGVDAIEAGFPASSANDRRAVERIAQEVKRATVVALARADKNDIDIAAEALSKANKALIHVFIATSDIHMEYKLRKSRAEVLECIKASVSYAKSKGFTVQFSSEDATRSDIDFLCTALKTAVEAGADIINIADTVGYCYPEEFGSIVKRVRACIPESIPFSVHCHNDLGLATANTVSALQNGADRAECTINGIGERAGNASLEELVMALKTRAENLQMQTNIDTKLLTKASHLVSSLTGVYVSPNKAIVGANAFRHESGIHQHGMLANSLTYEIMTPQSVGLNASEIVLGKHSGHHAFYEKAKELGYNIDEAVLAAAFASFKNLSCRKKEVSDDDVRALIDEAIIDSRITSGYELKSYQTQSGNEIRSMAMIQLVRDGKAYVEAAVGEGPIDAAFNAINRIVKTKFKLVSYNIKAVTGGTDALGEVRVRITDGNGDYNGRGFSTDIIESSIKAYINAINRAFIEL